MTYFVWLYQQYLNPCLSTFVAKFCHFWSYNCVLFGFGRDIAIDFLLSVLSSGFHQSRLFHLRTKFCTQFCFCTKFCAGYYAVLFFFLYIGLATLRCLTALSETFIVHMEFSSCDVLEDESLSRTTNLLADLTISGGANAARDLSLGLPETLKQLLVSEGVPFVELCSNTYSIPPSTDGSIYSRLFDCTLMLNSFEECITCDDWNEQTFFLNSAEDSDFVFYGSVSFRARTPDERQRGEHCELIDQYAESVHRSCPQIPMTDWTSLAQWLLSTGEDLYLNRSICAERTMKSEELIPSCAWIDRYGVQARGTFGTAALSRACCEFDCSGRIANSDVLTINGSFRLPYSGTGFTYHRIRRQRSFAPYSLPDNFLHRSVGEIVKEVRSKIRPLPPMGIPSGVDEPLPVITLETDPVLSEDDIQVSSDLGSD